MKILVVEDDLISSKVHTQMISKFGTCDNVDNGQKAIEQFQNAFELNTPYDIIFMDIMMPEVDGLQAVMAIRKFEALNNVLPAKSVKIVMTTALSDPRTVMKALYEADASSYIVKPITIQKLTDELRSLKLIP